MGGDVADTDDSHYFGSDAQIVVEKTSNGQDADAAPGPIVVVGDAVNWVYTVTNPGNVELSSVSVTDDVEGVIASPDSGDTDADNRLDPGETWIYTASGTASAGQYANTATAQGSPPVGGDVTDTDDSHYFGSAPQIVVEKSTNGQDADTAPGPYVAVGGAVSWVYTVTNPGNVELDAVSVTDDIEGVIAGPDSGDADADNRLDPGETGSTPPPGRRAPASMPTRRRPRVRRRSVAMSPVPTIPTTSEPTRRLSSRSPPTARTPTR